MQLICGLYGHRPAPLRTKRRDGILTNCCIVCQRPIERRADGGAWTLAERPVEG
jgi:hypothetical protein